MIVEHTEDRWNEAQRNALEERAESREKREKRAEKSTETVKQAQQTA
jgi:hypothetical protein